MGLFTRLFGSRNTTGEAREPGEGAAEPTGMRKKVPSARKPVPITLEVLKELFPVRNLGDEVLDAFADNREAEVFGPGSVLFQRGEPSDSVFYLLEGSVSMELGEGGSYEVQANTAKARFPLCSAKHYSATAVALTDIQVLRVSPKIMCGETSRNAVAQTAIDPLDARIPSDVRSSRLFQAFCQYYRDEELKIPSLPDVAIKLRKAVAQEADLDEVVKIVELDPAIAGKLVHVANSPLYLPARPISNCRDAVVRLGLTATRNLVVGYSLRQIFQCKDAYINQLLQDEWKKSVYLSSLCYVLASENGGVDAEEALLAGLVSDIGVTPFLYFAENFPREYWSPEDITLCLPWLHGPVGAFVLRRWDFHDEMVEIPLLAEDWFHDSGPELHLSDIVTLSKLHSYIGTPKMAELPSINSIPACGKLKDGQLSPEHSLNVLHQAKDKINQSLKLFS
jgi:HD-like signal output (HDOD) protein